MYMPIYIYTHMKYTHRKLEPLMRAQRVDIADARDLVDRVLSEMQHARDLKMQHTCELSASRQTEHTTLAATSQTQELRLESSPTHLHNSSTLHKSFLQPTHISQLTHMQETYLDNPSTHVLPTPRLQSSTPTTPTPASSPSHLLLCTPTTPSTSTPATPNANADANLGPVGVCDMTRLFQ